MPVPIVMPQLGLTMTEGIVSEWLKKPGEIVLKGEPIFVVSTDKADMEVESLQEGTLMQIIVEAGRTVPVGSVLAYLDQGGEGAVAASGPTKEELPVSSPKQGPERGSISLTSGNTSAVMLPNPSGERVRVTPRARKLARELGVDVTRVQGSGRDGRVVEEDVRRTVGDSHHQAAPPAVSPRHRQIIAEKMTRSIQNIPHFSLNLEVEATQLIALRGSLSKEVEEATGSKLTLTDLLLKGIGVALSEAPEFNAVWEEGTVKPRNTVDIGLAITTDRGVVAPVIRNVDKINFAEIASFRSEMSKKAARKALSLNELEGGIGTLSNLGMYRVDWFQAIISPGQSFILAVGKARNRPWIEATVVVRPTVILNLCVDHRVVDGAMAASFLGKVAEIIENPFRLLWKPLQRGGSK
jgi:pyruvate dehydrogenase E2 component (dihydrolipoyllysine-residue acetyltransferase)